MSMLLHRLDRHVAALCAVLALAAVLRFVGLDWDAGSHQHPDERHISLVLVERIFIPTRHGLDGLFDPATSDLNPRSVDPATGKPRQFAYGSLPLLLTEGASCLVDRLSGHPCASDPSGMPYWTTYEHEYLVGRFLNILADLALIVVTYALARRAFDATAGLVAAAFLAVSTLNIQLAHFFVTDTWSALFATASLWAMYRAAQQGPFARWSAWALAGALAGASVASKPNTMALAVPALIALWYSLRGEASDWLPLGLKRAALLGASTVVAFAMLEPYALPALGTYLRDFNEQAGIIGGSVDVPYTRQFVGALPVWHYLWNLWGYDLGAGLTTLGLLGVAASLRRAWRRRSGIDLMLLAWLVSYGIVINTVFAKFLRYMLPLMPVLAILAGALAAQLFRWAVARGRGAEQPSSPAPSRFTFYVSRLTHYALRFTLMRLLIGLALLAGLAQALAFDSIYLQPHSRIAASQWIYDNVPRGARIAAETWDDSLPLPLPDGRSPATYQYSFIPASHYDDRSPEEGLANIEKILLDSDYIILASQRIYGSTDRLPWRYPIVNRYYDLLFAGRLGFELVYQNTPQPTLGPLRLDSRFADESFSVYDHPPVHIFRKTAELSPAHLDALFAEALTVEPRVQRTPPKEKSLLLTEPLWTWPSLADEAWAGPAGNSWAALGLWLVTLLALTLVGLPWALLLFHGLADGGVAFARVLALALAAYPVWLGASLRWTTFSAPSVLVLTLAVGSVGWLLLLRRPELLAALRARRASIAMTEGLFWAAFGLALLLRLANPDLWQPYLGGEKPMEGAFLNAVLRSAYFPPYDPWFSGGYINYYYYGFVLVGLPIKLSGVAPAIAFNLIVATLYGLVAAAAGSLGQTLAAALAGRHRPPRPALVNGIGLGAAVLLVGIGNLDGALQVVERLSGALERFDFWRSSRVTQFVITEFPYFSFLFADLHAHIIAMPLALTLIAVALATVQSAAFKGVSPLGLARAWWPLALTASLFLGALAVTNAWDAPAYAALLAAACFIAAPFPRAAVIRRAAWAGLVTLLLAAVAYALYLPFFASFQSFYGSLGLTRIPTRLSEFLTIWGFFLVLVLVFLAVRLRAHLTARPGLGWSWPVIALMTAVGIATGAVVARGLWAPAILFPLIGLLGYLWLRNHLPPAGELTLVLLIGGLCIIAGVEFVYIVDFLDGGEWYRMNTVFKLYLEAWLLLSVGLAGGAALAAREWRGLPAAGRWAASGVVVVGLLASLAYPIFVTPDRLRQRFDEQPGPTLNGLAYMEVGTLRDPAGATIAFDEDLAVIKWMQATFTGQPVIVEAMIGPYRGNGSRISNATGFPTVLGWDSHESQQRWPETIGPRARDVRAIYTSRSPEQTLALLEHYDVDYVVVGQVERLTTLRQGQFGARVDNELYASQQGLAILANLARDGLLEEVFHVGSTVVYRVNRPLTFPDDRPIGPVASTSRPRGTALRG